MKTLRINIHNTSGKKLLILVPVLIISVLVITSCQTEKASDGDSIRKQISVYNAEILELSNKVSDLEKQLEDMGEKTQNRTRTLVGINDMTLQPFDNYFKVNASVEAVQEALISPETNGQIRQITVSKGQRVSAGQVLARLNTAVIDNSITEVKTSLQLAQTVYNRQKSLWEQEIGSEIQYLESKNNYESLQTRLKTLESQLDMSILRAPFNGVVDEIFSKEGELAMPGMPVMQLINLNSLYINADVSETFLPLISSKDDVILRFPAFPDYEEFVPVHRLGNVINPENRTFRLQVRINNPNDRFKPNMIASLAIKSYSTPEALVVPSILIKQDLQGHYVYLARENDEGDMVAKKVYIERGLDGEGKTMVKSGLTEGDKLIVQGHNQVNEGTLLEVSNIKPLALKE